MKVSINRWGDVLVRKAGNKPNTVDKQKSFSIDQTETNYSIFDFKEILEIVTNLTKNIKFKVLKNKLEKIK